MAKINALALDDFEALAQRVMPRSLHAFIAAGSEAGLTRDANRAAFAHYPLRTRAMRDVSARTTGIDLFGKHYAAPIGIPPMGMSGACWFEGDLELARAARDADIPFILSGASFEPLENVVADAPDAWFQAYPSGDPDSDAGLVARVAAAGYKVLVVTVDGPVPPSREAALRAGGLMVPVRPNLKLTVDTLLHPRWAWGTLGRTLRHGGVPRMANMSARAGPRITDIPKVPRRPVRDTMAWPDLARIRDAWKGPLVIKGILAPEDAAAARALGADAVIVSNHGGRQLDGTIAALDALPAVVAASGEMKVLFDSGVRRGGDVAKAIALGASMVFVGRPFLYALAAYGRPGVAHAIGLLQAELMRAMAMLGCTTIDEINGEVLAAAPKGTL
jgi:L-lactate dehydrogenase (cytochrome)